MARVVFLTCGPLESGGVFCRNSWFLAREQVFDSEYLKASELPERRIEHVSTGSPNVCFMADCFRFTPERRHSRGRR
jgi:glutamate/tyrosine decarboxylase-like PLP-dependent enzyme